MQQANNIIQKHLPQIQQLVRRHGVKTEYAFGSAVKENMRNDSDVDFIIRFPENIDVETYADNYFALINDLENLLDKKVELVAEETLSNPYLIQSINSHKMQVF